MKKIYKQATVKVIDLDKQDVIATSQSIDFSESVIVDEYGELFS